MKDLLLRALDIENKPNTQRSADIPDIRNTQKSEDNEKDPDMPQHSVNLNTSTKLTGVSTTDKPSGDLEDPRLLDQFSSPANSEMGDDNPPRDDPEKEVMKLTKPTSNLPQTVTAPPATTKKTVSITEASKDQHKEAYHLQQTTITAGSSSELTSATTYYREDGEQVFLFFLRTLKKELKYKFDEAKDYPKAELGYLALKLGLQAEKNFLLKDALIHRYDQVACIDLASKDNPQKKNKAFLYSAMIVTNPSKPSLGVQAFDVSRNLVKNMLISKAAQPNHIEETLIQRHFFVHQTLCLQDRHSSRNYFHGVFLVKGNAMLQFFSPTSSDFFEKLPQRCNIIETCIEHEAEILTFGFDKDRDPNLTSAGSKRFINQGFLFVLYRTTNTTSPQYFIKILSLSVTVNLIDEREELTSLNHAPVVTFLVAQNIPRPPVETWFNFGLSIVVLAYCKPVNHKEAEVEVTVIRIPEKLSQLIKHPSEGLGEPQVVQYSEEEPLPRDSIALKFEFGKKAKPRADPCFICDTLFIKGADFQFFYFSVVDSVNIWELGVRNENGFINAVVRPVTYKPLDPNASTGMFNRISELEEIKYFFLYQAPSTFNELRDHKKPVTLAILRGSKTVHRVELKYTKAVNLYGLSVVKK